MNPQRVSGAFGTDRASVTRAIAHAADRTGVDFTYLLNQAKSESGLNPTVRASTSSATGLFQFIDQSWLGVLKMHGAEHGYGWAANAIGRSGGRWTVNDPSAKAAIFALRKDPQAASLMAGEFASDNAAGLRKAIGREPTSTDLYFAHFLGLKGASRFLQAMDQAPDAPAASFFPRQAAANRGIFYRKTGEPRSFAQVYALMGRKIEGPGKAPSPERLGPPVQMASLEKDTVRLVDVPASSAIQASDSSATMLALRQGRMDVLRPEPKTAMLAYMMVVGSLGIV